jgi:phage replication O-like protein O
MSNPQKENGYVPIANELYEAFCKLTIPNEQRRLLDVIIRYTYGWNKKSDIIALSLFEKFTGIDRRNIVSSLRELSDKNIISIKNNGNRKPSTFSVNKNYKTWQNCFATIIRTDDSKKTKTIIRTDDKLSSVQMSKLSSVRMTTKDNKDIKDSICSEVLKKMPNKLLPNWIPKETFIEYLAMRKRIEKPLPEKSFNRAFKQLQKAMEESGHTAEDILSQSILHCWVGFYPVKQENSNRNGVVKI